MKNRNKQSLSSEHQAVDDENEKRNAFCAVVVVVRERKIGSI